MRLRTRTGRVIDVEIGGGGMSEDGEEVASVWDCLEVNLKAIEAEMVGEELKQKGEAEQCSD